MAGKWMLGLWLLAGCAAPETIQPPTGDDPWLGDYRYGGTDTKLQIEGNYYRFSDPRLARFYFRLNPGGWLEDETRDPVYVYGDVKSAEAGDGRPYRTLRVVWRDEDLFLTRRIR